MLLTISYLMLHLLYLRKASITFAFSILLPITRPSCKLIYTFHHADVTITLYAAHCFRKVMSCTNIKLLRLLKVHTNATSPSNESDTLFDFLEGGWNEEVDYESDTNFRNNIESTPNLPEAHHGMRRRRVGRKKEANNKASSTDFAIKKSVLHWSTHILH